MDVPKLQSDPFAFALGAGLRPKQRLKEIVKSHSATGLTAQLTDEFPAAAIRDDSEALV